MIKKAIFCLFFIFLFDSLASELELISKLYQKKYWSILLHFKNGTSEIDNPKFFLSPNGKTSLKDEFEATLKALLNDKSDNENSTMCLYPARSAWILENIPSLKKDIKKPKCENLRKYIAQIEPKSATLIFPTAYLNSPAAMFGHTFLRLNQNNSPLLSYAINFSAKTTDEINALEYVYKGIFGGFKGYFSVQKYYDKIKEYNYLQQRDIWEFELNFSPEELKKIVLHLVELDYNYSYYYFFSKNCSYQILWLFEIAREDLELIEKFNYKTIPLDTIKLAKKYNLITNVNFRISKTRYIKNILDQKIKNKKLSLNFIQNNQTIESLSKEQQIYTLDLAIEYFTYLQNYDKNSTLAKKTFNLMRKRSKLGLLKYNFYQPPSPLSGHNTSRIKSSFLKNRFEVGINPSYHSIKDNDNGFISGSYINFFDLNLEKQNNQIKLKNLKFINITSLSPKDELFNKLSWQGNLEIENINDKNYLNASFGIGFSLEKKLLFYSLITPNIYISSDFLASIDIKFGVLKNFSPKLKFGILGNREFFKEEKIDKLETFLTYNMTKDEAISFGYKTQKSKKDDFDTFFISLFYYF